MPLHYEASYVNKLEAERKMLRDALVGLVGASTKEELAQVMLGLRLTPGNSSDKLNAMKAIVALIETAQ